MGDEQRGDFREIADNLRHGASKKCLTCGEIELTELELEKGGVCFFCKYEEVKKAKEIFEKEDIEFPIPEDYGRRTEDFGPTSEEDVVEKSESPEPGSDPDPSKFKRVYSKEERKHIYERFGWDPEGVHLDPVIVRVQGRTEDVSLELQLPRVSDPRLIEEFESLLDKTLSFICRVNAFVPQHDDSLIQLKAMINGPGNHPPMD